MGWRRHSPGRCALLALLVLALATGASAVLADGRGRAPSIREPASPVIYPSATRALRFSHASHSDRASCVGCHAGATGSTRPGDRLVPGEDGCARCHEVESATTAGAVTLCGRCHPAYRSPESPPRFREGATRASRVDVLVPPPRSVFPAAYLRFSHAAHARGGIDCEACHAGVAEAESRGGTPPLPRMAACLECHDGRRADDACATCHLTDGAGRVRWRLPGGLLRPSGSLFDDAHDDAFLRGHGAAATRSRGHCESCHGPEHCQGCHDARRRPEAIHPGNWIALHAVPARKDPGGCASCHRSQSSCVRCHRRSHVVAEGEQRFPSDRAFHADGWTVGAGELAGPAHHGREARRSLRACTACHRESTCLSCHRSASVGASAPVSANPHGRGFTSRCAALMRRAERVCYRCHAATDAVLDRCR